MAGQTATEAIKARLRTLTGEIRSGGIKDMAELVDMPFPNVYRYVAGKGVPPHDFLAKVADRYNVSLDWLYGRSEQGGLEDAEALEPAWARRLAARLRFVERQIAELMPRTEVTEMVIAVESRVTETIKATATAEDLVDRYVDRTVEELRSAAPQLFAEAAPDPVGR